MKSKGRLKSVNNRRVCACGSVAVCAFFAFAPVPTSAATLMPGVNRENGDSVNAKGTPRQLKEVEVVSHRLSREVASTAPLYRLSAERMKALGVTDIADAMHRLPGVNLKDYGGAGGMKTVSVRGFGDQHTGVVYDGIVLSDCQNGRIDLSRYSLDNVGSLTMVVGDNSDIFIPAKWAASAASVIIESESVPAQGDSVLHLTSQLRFGSFDMINPYLKVGKRFDNGFAFSAIGDYTYAKNDYPFTLRNGYTSSRERRTNSRMNQGHAEVNGRYSFSPREYLQGKLFYYDNGRQLPGQVVLYVSGNNEFLRERNFFGQLSYRNQNSSRRQFQAFAKFNWDASHYTDRDGKYPGGMLVDDYRQREAYLSGSLLSVYSSNFSVNYSADIIYNDLTGNKEDIVNPSRGSILQTLSAKYKTSNFQVMARGLWSIYRNRVEKGEAAADANRLSPSVSLSWQPVSDKLFFLRASYKNIFRMPTFTEAYYFRMGNVTLRPEDTNQVNLGGTWQKNGLGWLTGITLTADCYANRVTDKIVVLPQNMYMWKTTNMGKVRSLGVDATVNAVAAIAERQTLTLAGNYSFQRVQPRTDPRALDYNKQLAYTPMNSGSASLSWGNPWVDCAAHVTAVGERYANSINLPISRLAPYADCGLSLMRAFKFRNTDAVDLRFDILNLLNTQYQIINAYPMPGINWKFTVKYGF